MTFWRRSIGAALCLLLCAGGATRGAEEGVAESEPVVSTPVAGGTTQAYQADVTYGENLQPQRIIVEATRIPTPIEAVTSPVSVFSGGEPGRSGDFSPNVFSSGNIETRQYRSISEVLRTVPGVSVYDYGGAGKQSVVSIRGMKAGHTRVMMDGMPLNDPAQGDGSFDFGWAGLDNISQFEVLRGSQSTLYGSSAAGGVVNLTSQKGEGELKGFLSGEAGSRGTARTRFGASAGNDHGDFSFAGTLFHTDGFSAASRILHNREKDAYDYGSFNLRLGANMGDNLRFDLFTNGIKGEVELDDPGVDQENYKMKQERFMVRPQVTLNLFDGMWEQVAGFGYVDTTWKGVDESSRSYNRYKYEGETFRFDYKSILRLHEANTVIVGVDVEEERMHSVSPWYGSGARSSYKHDVRTTGVYIEDQLNIRDTFFANAGARYTHHETFGDKVTWNAGAMYVLPTKTRLKASAGSGFKAPTLFNLYYPSGGNENLKAEKTIGWDAGIEQSFLCDRLTVGGTYFWNKVKDGIVWDTALPPFGGYNNIDEYKAYGIEAFVNYAPTDNLSISANYTWTRSKVYGGARSEMNRLPLNQANVNVDWKFLCKGTLTVGARYVGKQWDNEAASWPSVRVRMPSYVVARVGTAWKVNDHVEVFGRVENVLNKKYMPAHGYGCEPISFYGGATLSF